MSKANLYTRISFFLPSFFCLGVFFSSFVLGNKTTHPPVQSAMVVAALPFSSIIDGEICDGNIQDVYDKSPAMLLSTAALSVVKIGTWGQVHEFRG